MKSWLIRMKLRLLAKLGLVAIYQLSEAFTKFRGEYYVCRRCRCLVEQRMYTGGIRDYAFPAPPPQLTFADAQRYGVCIRCLRDCQFKGISEMDFAGAGPQVPDGRDGHDVPPSPLRPPKPRTYGRGKIFLSDIFYKETIGAHPGSCDFSNSVVWDLARHVEELNTGRRA